jgi:glutaminyl-peptide cyclotransferase
MNRLPAWPAALAAALLGGCMQTDGAPPAPPTPAPGRDQFAEDRDPPPLPRPALPFDGKRAMTYLEQLCAIGPRISGSAGMARQRELLRAHFTKLGASVTEQKFTARQASRRDAPVEMVNLIVSWHPEKSKRVLLCAHYDTRPIADQERDRNRWTDPFVSANDGTSGVAWLMELGHHVRNLPMQVGLDFVLFDGEEYVFDPSPPERGGDSYFLGSDHFAAQYRLRGKDGASYEAAILLDLFAGKNAVYPVEQNSAFKAGHLVDVLWGIAREQNVRAFRQEWGPAVSDDHLALNRVGIPAVDLIDFSYPHWHKLSDKPEQCSAESMEQVAKVIGVWLPRVKP